MRVQTMRSLGWPYSVPAAAFVDHYQVGVDTYPARWSIDLQMLTFEVGTPRRRPGRLDAGDLALEGLAVE